MQKTVLGKMLENVREQVPLVHNITNYVTVNDVANALLACGASPIMSDEPNDVEDITSICGGLNINIDTLNQRSIEGMFLAGKKAAEWKHPILLDPVGAGADGGTGFAGRGCRSRLSGCRRSVYNLNQAGCLRGFYRYTEGNMRSGEYSCGSNRRDK